MWFYNNIKNILNYKLYYLLFIINKNKIKPNTRPIYLDFLKLFEILCQ